MDLNLTAPTETALRELAARLSLTVDEIAEHALRWFVPDAKYRQERMLDTLVDHSRITGWLPDGSPNLKD